MVSKRDKERKDYTLNGDHSLDMICSSVRSIHRFHLPCLECKTISFGSGWKIFLNSLFKNYILGKEQGPAV